MFFSTIAIPRDGTASALNIYEFPTLANSVRHTTTNFCTVFDAKVSLDLFETGNLVYFDYGGDDDDGGVGGSSDDDDDDDYDDDDNDE